MDYRVFSKTFPRFKDEDPERVKLFLGMARGSLDKDAFGDSYDYATGLLSCHMLLVTEENFDKEKNIISETHGPMSFNYREDTEGLSETGYGRQLQSLIKRVVIPVV